MRTTPIALTIGLSLSLALAGCSKPTQEKTSNDLKAVGSDVGDAAKSVAGAPAMKELGADIKAGTQEAAAKTKVAADQAGEKLKAGADQAGEKIKAGAADAGAKIKSGAKEAGAKTDAAVDKAKDKVER